MRYVPSGPVVAPYDVPSMMTVAASIGSPVRLSVTVPTSSVFLARAGGPCARLVLGALIGSVQAAAIAMAPTNRTAAPRRMMRNLRDMAISALRFVE
jgi:hypothetical protein